MAQTAASAPRNPSHADWKKRFTYGVIILALVIVILLLRSCRSHPTITFDYFRDKAAELKNDPVAIQKFVAENIATLEYRGNVKGALATLWNKAGSPEEKKALADALLQHVKQPPTLTIDDVAPARNKSTDTSTEATQTFQLKIIHRVIQLSDKDESKPIDTPIFAGPIGDLVGDVHTIEETGPLKTTFTLRGKTDATRLVKDVTTPDDAVAEQVVFIYSTPTLVPTTTSAPKPGDASKAKPNQPAPPPTAVIRELWHTGNTTGANHPTLHDRHDFVVLPGRIDKFVREKEELILKEYLRNKSPEARGYLMLLDFAVKSDKQLAGLEKRRKVTAQFNKPRILMLSKFIDEEMPEGAAWALDLRADDVTFNGDFTTAYLATQARSFMESGLEQSYLAESTGIPSTSTFEVFSRLKDDYPNTCARRLIAIRQILSDLRSFSSVNASATFNVHLEQPSPWKSSPQVVVTREPSGVMHLHGPPALKKFIERLASTPGALKIKERGSAFDDDFTNMDDLAVAVETALMSADVSPGVEPGYVLESKLDRGAEPLVEQGSQFVFSWGDGDDRTDQRIYVADCGENLSLKWRVQTGPMPAAGTRRIESDALAGAMVHNPWYRTGSSTQTKATSFCVSRAVYRQIKAGKSVNLSVQARMSDKDDALASRPVEYTAVLKPVGNATHEVTINGKKNTIKVIQCKLKDADVAILDDPSFPVGMADKLTNIVTGIRARLVDETGVPIAGADVTVTAPLPSEGLKPISALATTLGDGSMRLAPPIELDTGQTTYGKAKVSVRVSPNDKPIETTVDLTTPGLDTVEIKIIRPRPKLMYFTKGNSSGINDLPISNQVKRNARRDVNAGKLVVIPNRMISDGIHSQIGYYACDRSNGYYVGVTEDGLNGSSAWNQAVMTAVKAAAKARTDVLKGTNAASAPFQMFRGAVISWWVYCTDRLAGDTNKTALIDTLAAMENWAKSTNLSTYVNKAIADAASGSDPTALAKLDSKLTGMFSSMISSGIVQAEGDTADAAFEIGYISGTAGLAALIGDDDSD